MASLEELVEEFAKQYDLTVGREKNRLILSPSKAPLFIAVEETSRGVKVYIGHKGLRDYVREIVDTEENPRDYFEELLDDLTSLAYRLSKFLEKQGLRVVLETREAVMDILDEVEEALEE